MKVTKNYFLFLMLLGSAVSVEAQLKNRCNFSQLYNKIKLDSSFIKSQNEFNNFLKSYHFEKSDTVIRIPIVFHIVYRNQTQNISDEQVESQLIVLNKDFRKLNSDTTNATGHPITDVKIEFCMAKETPSGALTNGITRTLTSINKIGTTNSYYTVAPIWDREKYINVWVCDNDADNFAIGFAVPPAFSNVDNEGIVIDFTAFGTLGTAKAPFNKGRTLTHELGHMFNLLHPWGEQIGISRSCGFSDFVDDTPEQKEEVLGCPSSIISCNSNDMLSNFMGYINDSCMGNYTPGQKERMRAAIKMFRPSWASDEECWPVGLKERDLVEEIELYPNPNSGSFTFNLSPKVTSKGIKYFIYNVSGKQVEFDLNSNNQGFEIDFKNNVSGVYFLRIESHNSSLIKKVILNKD